MQSSRWAPTHRSGTSVAPSTNAAILSYEQAPNETTAALSTASAAVEASSEISKGGQLGEKDSLSTPAAAPGSNPARDVTPAIANATPSPKSAPVPVPTFDIPPATLPASATTAQISLPTSINPQAPEYVPLASKTPVFTDASMQPALTYALPDASSHAPENKGLQATHMEKLPMEPSTYYQDQTSYVIPAPQFDQPQYMVSDPSWREQGSESQQETLQTQISTMGQMNPYDAVDPYGQTAGETSDLFFGDDFTPIAQPIPQPVVQPIPEPVSQSLEPQLQQLNAANEAALSVPQFQPPKGPRESRRARGRGRGEGRGRGRGEGRGEGRGSGRGRGSRRGGRGAFEGKVNGMPPSSTTEKKTTPSPPTVASEAPKPSTTEHTVEPGELSTALEHAPTGPSQPASAPAVRGDRSATGGVRRPKLTEEELSAKLAAVRLKNQEREAAHKAAAEDEANFRAQEERASKEAIARRKEEAREQRELMQERERNRLRKMKKMGGREWDEGKETAGLMEGTGRAGYGQNYRGRGHYRRGANGGIPGFVTLDRNQPMLNGSLPTMRHGGEADNVTPEVQDSGHNESPFTSGRGGRYGRGRGEARGRGRGGRGRGGGGAGSVLPGMARTEFPALGGEKAEAAKAAVQQAGEKLVTFKKDNAVNGTNGTPKADEHESKIFVPDYAAALARGGRGLGRKVPLDECRIASWADQVEEAM